MVKNQIIYWFGVEEGVGVAVGLTVGVDVADGVEEGLGVAPFFKPVTITTSKVVLVEVVVLTS
jgi:hypothetical protein